MFCVKMRIILCVCEYVCVCVRACASQAGQASRAACVLTGAACWLNVH